MRVALDTNILAYAEGVNGAARKANALELIQRLPAGSALLPVQTLGELFQLLVRKVNRTPAQARSAILGWRDAFPLIETSETVIVGAAELAATHRFSFWDGVVLASAAEGGCRLLLSEAVMRAKLNQRVFRASSTPCMRHTMTSKLDA